ncbi:TPA: capsule biosynthesis protein, partial [Pasteurella multocida]|nr:capsule biosynthesis protein [Pasteurella multocida]
HNLDELIEISKNILLLQGPIGAFFMEFSLWLQQHNKTVFKLNLNKGDDFFYSSKRKNTFEYTDSLDYFFDYLNAFCADNRIDSIVCFGDNRKYHQYAKKVAKQLNISFWVFEEGYFRPDYVTLEKNGVNDFSTLPRDANFFLKQALHCPLPPEPLKLAKGFIPLAKLAIQYYINASTGAKYPHYQHHRILDIKYYIKLWTFSGIKRLCYFLQERSLGKKIEKGFFDDFFIVPLQVYDDSQVKVHCDYDSVESFLREVLDSFVRYAPKTLNLIIKHHPMDRGFIDYGCVIKEYQTQYPSCKHRILYVHDVPTPILLRKGKGMITLNSTSGISALLHRMPVLTLGRASYNFEGLTYQGNLHSFWHNKALPDAKVFEAYRKYHLSKTQINGSFYSKVILRYPYNQ